MSTNLLQSPLYHSNINLILITCRRCCGFWYPFPAISEKMWPFRAPASPGQLGFILSSESHSSAPTIGRSDRIFGGSYLLLSLCTCCFSTDTLLSIEHPYAKWLQGLQKHYPSLSLWIPMERVGDQDTYFATEESDLAKVAWGTGGSGSVCLFSSAQAAPPTSKEQSSSCSLSPEGRENVKGYQDSSCRAQTHYQLGLRIKKNPLYDILPSNYELHPGLKQLTWATIKILNPIWGGGGGWEGVA